jgi:hypothetical protein
MGIGVVIVAVIVAVYIEEWQGVVVWRGGRNVAGENAVVV